MPDPRPPSSTGTAELELTPPDATGDPAGADFEELPGRPLRKRFGPVTYLLLGLIVACGAFYGGARYGKSSGTSGSTGSGLAALASRLGASTSGKTTTGGAFPSGGSFPSRSSKTVPSGSSATGSRAFSFLGGGISGTIKLITGKDFYVEESTGTVVKVDTGTGTSITVSSASSVTDLHPGDSVTVVGTNKSGTVSATRVTDSGSATATKSKG